MFVWFFFLLVFVGCFFVYYGFVWWCGGLGYVGVGVCCVVGVGGFVGCGGFECLGVVFG